MNIYQVDKLECAVTLFLLDGMIREGVVFLSPFSPAHAGPQTLLELFNADAPFLPLRKADGSFGLVNKAMVSHVRFASSAERGMALGSRLPVRMVFVGGEVLGGTMTVEAPEGKDRLQDFLNDRRAFFLLDCGDAHYLVNPRLICEIAPT